MSVRDGEPGAWGVSPRLRILLVLSVCLCWALLFASIISRGRVPGDDNLYLQSIAVSAKSPAMLDHLNRELIDGLATLGYRDDFLYRVVLRSKYTQNYWAASKIQSLVTALLPVDPAMGMQAYHERVATRAVLSSIAPGLISVLALAGGLLLIRDPKLFIAAIVGVSIAAALYNSSVQADMQTLLPHIPERVPDDMSWIDAFGRSAYFFVNPGLEFSMFGPTPRSNLVIFAFVAVLMRWENRLALSYLVLAVGILFHASAGSIILCLFLISNLVFRPTDVIRPAPLLAIGLCMALAVSQESLTSILGFTSRMAIPLLVVLSLLAFGLFRLLKARDVNRARPLQFLNSTFPDRVTADFVVFLFFWNFTLAMLLARLGYLDFASVVYLWSQFHARTAALLQPMLITAMVLFVIRFTPTVPYRLLATFSLVLLFIACATNNVRIADPRPEFVRNLARLEERRLATFPYAGTPSHEDEPLWYYAILHSLDFKSGQLGLLPR